MSQTNPFSFKSLLSNAFSQDHGSNQSKASAKGNNGDGLHDIILKELSTEKHVLPSDIDTWTQSQKVNVRVLAVRTVLLPGKWSGCRRKPNGLFWRAEKLLDLAWVLATLGLCVLDLHYEV